MSQSPAAQCKVRPTGVAAGCEIRCPGFISDRGLAREFSNLLCPFPTFDRRKIEASFQGGEVSSDGGVMLLREANRRLGLTRALNAALPGPCDPDLITHEQIDLLRQRIYGLALGYEDLNMACRSRW
jgi:hypothetical protein